jgi:hypothetical protein
MSESVTRRQARTASGPSEARTRMRPTVDSGDPNNAQG